MRRSPRQLLVLFALPVLALIFTPQTTAAQGGTIRGRPLRRSDKRTLPVHSAGADWTMSGLWEGRLFPGTPLPHTHILQLDCGARAGSPY